MARLLRIEVPGGWYHLTSRGNARQRIFHDDRDRGHFLELLTEGVERFKRRLATDSDLGDICDRVKRQLSK